MSRDNFALTSSLALLLLSTACFTSSPTDDTPQAEPGSEAKLPSIADADWKDGERIEVDWQITGQRDGTATDPAHCTFAFDVTIEDQAVVFTQDLLPPPATQRADLSDLDLIRRRIRCSIPSFAIDRDGNLLRTDAEALSTGPDSKAALEQRAALWRRLLTGQLPGDTYQANEHGPVACEDDSADTTGCLKVTYSHIEDLLSNFQADAASHERVERAERTDEYQVRYRTDGLPPERVVHTARATVVRVDERTDETTSAVGEDVDEITIRRVR